MIHICMHRPLFPGNYGKLAMLLEVFYFARLSLKMCK
jgi:hypothetical protein